MKTENKQHFKGSVLFTVVSVMSLLIVFLMGTLVLATSASNRSHKNYSSTQAEYTARAAIESFSQAMGRNAAIAQSVINMELDESGKPLEPTVSLADDSQMGSIGYYDIDGNWVDNKIRVEKVDKTYVYTENGWESMNVLKVTATARVGKEESTISAYMRTKAPNEPSSISIKGFQTLDSNGMTTEQGYVSGAMAVGILNPGAVYYAYNDTSFETDLNFINSSLHVEGNSVTINVHKPDVETVIMGDLTMQNSLTFNIDYPADSLTPSTVPHLYVDGSFIISASASIPKFTKSNKLDALPYNIICGSLKIQSENAVNFDLPADLYIMGNEGQSEFGHSNTSNLVSWCKSVSNGGNTEYYSTSGGNIFCNEYLDLKQAVVAGNVQVNDNLQIGNNTTINGDVVVAGNLNITGENAKIEGNLAVIGSITLPDGKSISEIVDGNVYGGDIEGSLPFSDYGIEYDNIYPKSMTRDAVLGNKEGGKYKIVTTLDEVKENIGYSEDEEGNGVFDPDLYKSKLPDNLINSDGTYNLPVEELKSNTKVTITQSCILKSTENLQNIEVLFQPSVSEIWVVLSDGFKINSGTNIFNVSKNGIVNFFLDGTAQFDNFQLFTSDILTQVNSTEGGNVVIKENDSINVNIYGKEGSALELYNQSLICASAKCPYTTFKNTNNYVLPNGRKFEYIPATGEKDKFIPPNGVAWIGNALFKERSKRNEANNFTMFYAGAGGGKNEIVNDDIKSAWKIMYYDVY